MQVTLLKRNSSRNICKFHMKNLILTLRRYRQLKLEFMSNFDAIFVSKYNNFTECFLATPIMAKGPFPSNRAGPLHVSGINLSCVHMVVFIPLGGMKFDIDWYVYLIVWKINYAIPSTHSLFNIFHPGRRDEVFIWEIFHHASEISAASAEISLCGPARLPIWTS